MKDFKILLTSLLLVFCILGSLVACTVSNDDAEPTEAYSYIAIDINPSLELVVDKDGMVASVNALNDDALVLISGESIEGLNVEDASELIVSLASELGYLNEENTDVNFTVVAEEENVSAELEVKLEQGAKKGCDIAEIKFKAEKELGALVEQAKEEYPELEEKLHAGKLHLFYAIQKFDEDFTVEQGLELSVPELAKMLHELKKENDDKTPKEARDAIERHFKEKKEEARRQIAGVYGEDFLEKWESNEELKDAFEKFKAEYDAIYVSSEDVSAIEELLEIDLSQIKENDGSIKLSTLNEEISKALKECAKEIHSQVVAILKAYEEQILNSEEFKSAMDELKPEPNDTETDKEEPDLDFESFEEFKGFVKEKDEKIKNDKKDIELNEEQREQIEGFKQEMKDGLDELEKELGEMFEHFNKLFPNRK